MDWKLGGLILALPFQAVAIEPAVGSDARPYFDCMEIGSGVYGELASDPDDAIAAARATCLPLRQDLEDLVAARWIIDGYPPKDADRFAEGVIKQVDDEIRGELVRAALLAKSKAK